MNNQILPIVMDIETSGTHFEKSGIWQIGAIDLNTMEEFFDECRIDDEDKVITNRGDDEDVFEIIGKTEEELRDSNKQSQKELLEKFFKWIENKKFKNFICQNPQFDISFFEIRSAKYGLKEPFHHRAFDTHSIAQTKFVELNNELLMKEDYSGMNLANVLKLCGLEDNRGAHNALEDAKMTGECFMRLMFGKNIFQEFEEFEIPEVLRK